MNICDVANLIALICGTILVFFLFKKLNFERKAPLYTLLTIPFLFFNTFFLCDALTADEQSYIPAFGDMGNIEPGSVIWNKGSLQYRATQIAIGFPLRVLRKIIRGIDDNTVNVVYKVIHWLLFFLIALVIVYLWSKYITSISSGTLVYRLFVETIVVVMTGLPVACLILKVANYDAGNIYFAILGISLVIVSEKKNNIWIARIGVFSATLGCIEKWTSLIYLLLVIAFTVFLEMKRSTKMKFLYFIKELIIGLSISVLICFSSLFLIRVIQGKGFIDFTPGIALFPLTFMISVFLGKGVYDAGHLDIYQNGLIMYLLVFILLICFTSICTFFVSMLEKKMANSETGVVRPVIGLFGVVFVLTGILGAFFLHRFSYPFVPFPEGIYEPRPSGNHISYFYGAKTIFGHYLADFSFTNAVAVVSLPSVIMLAILGVGGVTLFKNKVSNGIRDYVWGISFILFPIFTIAGQSACARYFGVSIMIICLCTVNELFFILEKRECKEIIVKISCAIAFVFCIMELSINLPLYNVFSPVWLIRSDSFRNEVRTGEWDAGEAMTWGEDLAIAGKWIERYAKKNGIDINNTVILSNYGINWYSNPGFKIIPYDSTYFSTENDWEYDRLFFVFTKFKLFRKPTPEYIIEVEPLKRIKIKGETIVWIYTAEQLKEYIINEKM